MKLCYYGNPVLREKAKPIVEITDEIRQMAADMLELIQDPKHPGCGLAAPQIGESIRLFVILLDHYEEDGTMIRGKPHVYINPILSDASEETDVYDEGCLSMPGFRIPVVRPVSITIEALNLDGEKVKERFDGIAARARMHENDHINGVLMIDRAAKADRKAVEPILRQIKKQYA